MATEVFRGRKLPDATHAPTRFGRVLLAFLAEENWPLTQLAEKMETNHSNLSQAIRGRRMSPKLLPKLCLALPNEGARCAIMVAHLGDEFARSGMNLNALEINIKRTAMSYADLSSYYKYLAAAGLESQGEMRSNVSPEPLILPLDDDIETTVILGDKPGEMTFIAKKPNSVPASAPSG